MAMVELEVMQVCCQCCGTCCGLPFLKLAFLDNRNGGLGTLTQVLRNFLHGIHGLQASFALTLE